MGGIERLNEGFLKEEGKRVGSQEDLIPRIITITYNQTHILRSSALHEGALYVLLRSRADVMADEASFPI
jgi:hypothetical protein